VRFVVSENLITSMSPCCEEGGELPRVPLLVLLENGIMRLVSLDPMPVIISKRAFGSLGYKTWERGGEELLRIPIGADPEGIELIPRHGVEVRCCLVGKHVPPDISLEGMEQANMAKSKWYPFWWFRGRSLRPRPHTRLDHGEFPDLGQIQCDDTVNVINGMSSESFLNDATAVMEHVLEDMLKGWIHKVRDVFLRVSLGAGGLGHGEKLGVKWNCV